LEINSYCAVETAFWHQGTPQLAVLAYWVVSVTRYRLKLKEYPNVRWDEIMRIAQAQVLVTNDVVVIATKLDLKNNYF
jgi:hypothetical protein